MPANLMADIWHAIYRQFYTPIAAIGENDIVQTISPLNMYDFFSFFHCHDSFTWSMAHVFNEKKSNKVNCNRRHVIGFKGSDRTMRDIDMAVSRKYSHHDQCAKLKYQEKPLKRHPSFQICRILQCLKNKVSQSNSPWASIPFGFSFSFQKATRK